MTPRLLCPVLTALRARERYALDLAREMGADPELVRRALRNAERRGLATSAWGAVRRTGRPPRVYAITDAGLAVLDGGAVGEAPAPAPCACGGEWRRNGALPTKRAGQRWRCRGCGASASTRLEASA